MSQFQWINAAGAGELFKILDDPQQRRSFVAFCKMEYSTENVICMLCIGLYQRAPDWDKARLMQRLFFDGNDSPHEVNVTKSSCDAIYRAIYNNRLPFPDRQLFVPVTNSISSNLGDTYSRYIFTAGGKEKIGLAQRVLPTKLGGLGRSLDRLAVGPLKPKFSSQETRNHMKSLGSGPVVGPEWAQSARALQAVGFDLRALCLI